MKRLLKRLGAAAAILLLLLLGSGLWFLRTPSGAQGLLAAVSALTPVKVEAGAVRGRLADDLRLEKLAVEWPGGGAKVGRLRLLWEPARLLRGRLVVEELSLEGIEIRLRETPEEPEPPPDLSFPEIPSFLLRAGGELGRLELKGLVLHPVEGEPLKMDRLSARLLWREGILTVDGFSLDSPAGKLRGEAAADFVAPSLRGELTARAKEPVRGMDRFALDVDLDPAPGLRHLAGKVKASAAAGKTDRLRLEAEVDWTRDRLTLPALRLLRPGTPGTLTGRASVRGAKGWPFDLALRLSDMDLSPETGIATDLSGEIAASGTFEGYRGRFSIVNDAPGWRGGRLAADFAGSDSRIALSGVTGRWLEGTLAGSLSAGWKEGWSLRADLSGEGLNSAEAIPEWPGRINVTLRAAAEKKGEAPLAAQVEGRLAESTLRGRALTGEVDASLRGDDLRIARLLLRGDGFDLFAEGRLRERVAFRADIPRLSGLLPGARGSVDARGWVRWREKYLTGALAARGRGIAAAGARVDRFSLEASHEKKGAPFSVSAELAGGSRGDVRLESASFSARGVLGAHTLRATTSGSDVGLRLAARGGYADGRWSGTVGELETSGRLPGRWTLAAPAPVELSRKRLRVPSFRLKGPGEESLRVAADLALSPLRGTAEGEWRRIDLARANPWVKGMALEGRSSGALRVRWLQDGRLDLSAKAQAAGSALREGRRLTVEEARAELSWGPAGLRGAWSAELGGLGSAEGRVSSPHPPGGGLPPSGELSARWRLADLARISPWLPEIGLAGRSSGEVSGAWNEDGPVRLRGRAEMRGRVIRDPLRLEVRKAQAALAWGEKGLDASWEIDLGEAGSTSGWASSEEPPQLALPRRGEIEARWRQLDLGIFAPWIGGGELSGRSSGEVRGSARADGRLDLKARLDLAGRIAREDMMLEIAGAEADVRWDEGGLRGGWRVALAPGGRLRGEVLSPEPARLRLPGRGTVRAEWEGIDLARLRPWLPPGLLLEGTLAGRVEGELLPGERLRGSGSVRVTGGELQWEGEDGILAAPLRQAEVRLDWREEALRGEMELLLEDYGRAAGEFRIPVPARLPVALLPDGPVRGRLTASLRERGLLQALFPGLVQESRGRLELDLRAGGTWREPDLGGEARLADAGAYLPSAGIRLREVGVRAQLEGEEIRITDLRVRSGPGRIEGSGAVRLQQWKPIRYSLRIRGKDFEAVDLPELRIVTTPDLTLEGSRERLVVRGEVRLPEVLFSGRETPAPVEPSPDVVIIDAPPIPDREFPLALDVQVRIILGEHVLVRAEGVDARLEGALLLTMTGLDPGEITARGKIRVAQGKYSAYGVSLDITRGNILFAGGPVDLPTLDILAMRKRGEVRAGVRITGTPRQPQVKLTSEPAMPDTDILSYIVLGRPLGQGGGGADAGLLMLAANQLLARGESAVLQDRIKRTLGIDVLEVESGGGEEAGARITIGKYLRPDLYISFGRGLFAETQEVRLRYDLSRHWQIESSVGTESAVDLFYQIEFK